MPCSARPNKGEPDMSAKWSEAANAYRRAQAAKEQIVNPQAPVAEQVTHAAISKLQHELSLFISGDEGRAAVQLLSASNRFVRLGEDRGDGHAIVYTLTGNGFERTTEASGMWTIFSSNVPKAKSIPCTNAEIASSACLSEFRPCKSPDEVMPYLRAELEKIAAAAPTGYESL